MIAGFRDLLALVLRWNSSIPTPAEPRYVAAGRVWHHGATAAQVFITGQQAGKAHG